MVQNADKDFGQALERNEPHESSDATNAEIPSTRSYQGKSGMTTASAIAANGSSMHSTSANNGVLDLIFVEFPRGNPLRYSIATWKYRMISGG